MTILTRLSAIFRRDKRLSFPPDAGTSFEDLIFAEPGVPVRDFAPVERDEPRLWDEAFGDDTPDLPTVAAIVVVGAAVGVACLIIVGLHVWGVI